MDGFQPVSLIDELALLPGFQRRGAGIVFSETSLARLERIKPTLANSLLANVTNFFAFRTTLQDSELVTPELGAELTITELPDLPFHSCYARIQQGDRTAPGRRMRTNVPSSVRSTEIRNQILSQSNFHTRQAEEVAQAQHEFEDE